MKIQVPHRTIKKKQYQRSKWDDFNKVKVTFILKQFTQNIIKYNDMLERLGHETKSVTMSPLTQWFLSLPKTQGRSQEIVRLAFVHNYGYIFGKGTEIGSFKNNKNPFFNEYLRMENDINIGIDRINFERQKHRQILRKTTEKVMRDYISKKNPRKPSKRARFTKKDIKEDERDDFFQELQKFFNQLVRQPTKEEIAQQYEDPEEFDDLEKEYVSDDQFVDDDDSKGENRCNPQVNLQLKEKNVQNIQSEDQELQYIPSPVQSRKSFSLSQFDVPPPLSMVQSEDECENIKETIPRVMKKTSSEDQERMKKVNSMNLCLTDQQFEYCQKLIASKRREQDLCDWNGF